MNAEVLAPKRNESVTVEPQELLFRLRTGGASAFEIYSADLMHRLARSLGTSIISSSCEGHRRLCLFARPDLCVRGFFRDDTCVLILGDHQSWPESISNFWSRVESPIDLPLIICCSEPAAELAIQKVGARFACVLREADTVRLLTANLPLETLCTLLRDRFAVETLHPFDHHHPVADFGFCGRHELLKQIAANPQRNYALIGPSKMGKTSLIKRLHLAERGKGKSHLYRVYVDLYNVTATDAAVARALRMAMDPGATAYYDDPDHFPAFLEKASARFDASFEIVLDEVDKHCGLNFIRTLIHLAEKRICRVILIGRWRLMREAIHSHDDNLSRLDPIILEPLDVSDAIGLLERPLHHLGCSPHLIRHELRSAVNRLGRVPGHLQEFGCLLIDELRHTDNALTAETVRRALARIITSSRLSGLLDDLSSPAARAAALLLIFSPSQVSEANPLWLREQFTKRGLTLRIRDCMEILNELVIHHLLTYENKTHHICRWDVVAESETDRKVFEEMLEEELELAATAARN